MLIRFVLVGAVIGFLYGYLSPVSFSVRVPVEMSVFVGQDFESSYYGFKTAELYGDALVMALKQEGISAKRLSPLHLEITGKAASVEGGRLLAATYASFLKQKASLLLQGQVGLSLVVGASMVLPMRVSLELSTGVGVGFLVSVFVFLEYVQLYRRLCASV